MEIRRVPVDRLNPAAYNPRRDLRPGDAGYDKLARSMEKFGCVEPVVWNQRTGNVVGGHQRLKILRAACVEIDCQKVLGVEDAWYFRERMRRELDNPQINVFHFEDGKRGLDSLIDFSSYLALSIPELRIIKPKTFREDTRQLVRYIKERKPEIDIHLLGCTDMKIIAENRFCTSADSTSWLAGVRYGYIDDGVRKGHMRQFRRDLFQERSGKIRAILASRGVALAEKSMDHITNASLCATICKRKYEQLAGPQN